MPIHYQLDARPDFRHICFFALQFLAFNIANIAVVPIIIGGVLGLNQTEIADLAQRTIFFAAIATLLQVVWGHRLPLLEGPAGTWWGIFIVLAAMALNMGKSLAVLRTDLETGLILAGLVLILIGLTGLVGFTLKLFTPAVTGTVLILLTIQLAGPFVKGMFGITATHNLIEPRAVVISLITVATVVIVNLKGRGFLRSIAVLIGIVLGWLATCIIGLPADLKWVRVSWLKLPSFFAWGAPTVDWGIIITSILSGFIILSSQVAALLAMERTLDSKLTRSTFNRGIIFNGIADLWAGLGATVGLVSYAASAGFINITGVAARIPFIVATLFMLVIGLFPPISLFLSSIPVPVGYAVMTVSFCQLLLFGFKDYAKLGLVGRDFFVIGIPLIVGTGIMSLPVSAFTGLPNLIRYSIGNGFILGMILCLLLEHLVLPGRFFSES